MKRRNFLKALGLTPAGLYVPARAYSFIWERTPGPQLIEVSGTEQSNGIYTVVSIEDGTWPSVTPRPFVLDCNGASLAEVYRWIQRQLRAPPMEWTP